MSLVKHDEKWFPNRTAEEKAEYDRLEPDMDGCALRETGCASKDELLDRLMSGELKWGVGAKKVKAGGSQGGKGISGVPHYAHADDAGNIDIHLPVGMPPDIVAGIMSNVRVVERKSKLKARLRQKLAEKHGHHTGEECDRCFWEK